LKSGNKKHLYPSIFAATFFIACMAIAVASAQTFNPQPPQNFGDFNGTRPDFPGNPGDFNGSQGFPGGMGPGGNFNGTMGGPDGGNFTRPDFSGAPQYNPNNISPGAVSGSQTDYTFIIVAVVAVVAVVSVAAVMLVRRKKAVKAVSSPPSAAEENFDF
jgi:hypothetical protein